MLVVVLCCLIVLLLLLLFMQNLRQKRNNRMQSTAQERQHKPDQQRVTYLEPRVTAEQTVMQAEVVEQPVIDAPVSQAESADDVLGLSATRTQADSSPSLPSQQPSAELGAAMQEQSVAKAFIAPSLQL